MLVSRWGRSHLKIRKSTIQFGVFSCRVSSLALSKRVVIFRVVPAFLPAPLWSIADHCLIMFTYLFSLFVYALFSPSRWKAVGWGIEPKGLLHAGQALYPLGHILSPDEIVWTILPHGVVCLAVGMRRVPIGSRVRVFGP